MHLKVEMAVLAACEIGVVLLQHRGVVGWRDGGVFLLAYLFSSLFLSPDLDLSGSRASRRWGVGRILWLPYAIVFRHRRLSHHLLLGPLTRITYLGGIVLAVFSVIGLVTGRAFQPFSPERRILLCVLAGLYLPNQIHILVDRVWSFARGWRRGKRL